MKVFKTAFASAFCALLVATGCSSDSEALPEENLPPPKVINLQGHTKDVRVGTRDLTLNYIPHERHGAAVEEGSYKHVLAVGDVNKGSPMMSGRVRFGVDLKDQGIKFTRIKIKEPASSTLGKTVLSQLSSDNLPQSATCKPYDDILEVMGRDTIRAYAADEIDVWQRFCNCGQDMTAEDWGFVNANRDGFPAEMASLCRPPSYSELERYGLLRPTDTQVLYRRAFGNSLKGSALK